MDTWTPLQKKEGLLLKVLDALEYFLYYSPDNNETLDKARRARKVIQAELDKLRASRH